MTSEAFRMKKGSFAEGARLLNESAYLFLIEIREVQVLELCVTITEGKPQAPITEVDEKDPLGFLRLGGRPVDEDVTCRHFQLLFAHRDMVMYRVLNESYGKAPEASEVFTGKLFRAYSESRLLTFTKQTTYASGEYLGSLLHFEIICADHIVDVVCTAPPAISIGTRL